METYQLMTAIFQTIVREVAETYIPDHPPILGANEQSVVASKICDQKDDSLEAKVDALGERKFNKKIVAALKKKKMYLESGISLVTFDTEEGMLCISQPVTFKHQVSGKYWFFGELKRKYPMNNSVAVPVQAGQIPEHVDVVIVKGGKQHVMSGEMRREFFKDNFVVKICDATPVMGQLDDGGVGVTQAESDSDFRVDEFVMTEVESGDVDANGVKVEDVKMLMRFVDGVSEEEAIEALKKSGGHIIHALAILTT